MIWHSAHPQIFEQGMVQCIVERMLDEIYAKSPNLSDDQAIEQTLKAIKKLFQRPRKDVLAWLARKFPPGSLR